MTVYPSELAGVGGSRHAMRQMGRAIAEEANDKLVAALCDPDREMRFIAALDAGVRQCDRTCMQLFAQMRQLVGTQIDLAVHVVNVIGAQPTEARSSVEIVRGVERMSEADMVADSVRFLSERGFRCLPPEAETPEATVEAASGPRAASHGENGKALKGKENGSAAILERLEAGQKLAGEE